jgi:hypothetical protein
VKEIEIGSNNEVADATSSNPSHKNQKMPAPSREESHVGVLPSTGKQGQQREINMQPVIGIAHLLATGI